VPHAIVKDILTQWACLGIHGKWLSRIREYDMEIRPTKLVKGQGLSRILIDGNEKELNTDKEESSKMVVEVLDELERHEWYVDIVYYLKNSTCPNHLVYCKRRALRLKTSKYCII